MLFPQAYRSHAGDFVRSFVHFVLDGMLRIRALQSSLQTSDFAGANMSVSVSSCSVRARNRVVAQPEARPSA